MERITPPDYEVMFSVEVTTYNQEKFIAQALDSILTQEHNYKYEISFLPYYTSKYTSIKTSLVNKLKSF